MSFQDAGDAIVAAAGGEEAVTAPVDETQVAPVEGAPLEEGAAPVVEEPVVEEPTLESRFAALEGTLGTMAETLREVAQARPAGAPEEPQIEESPTFTVDDLLSELDDENFTPDGVITTEGLGNLVASAVDRALGQRDQRANQERVVAYRTEQLGRLVEAIPALEQDPQVQDRVVDGVQSLANSVARELGMDPGVLAQSPTLVGLVCDRLGLRQAPASAATPSPQPTTPPAVPVGRPTGRAPVTPATETVDEGDAIVARAQAGRFRG